jgi:hypothetical protein
MYYPDIILGYCALQSHVLLSSVVMDISFKKIIKLTSNRALYPATFFFAIINTRDLISMSDEKLRSLNINGNLVWALKAFYEFWPRQPMQIINYDLKSGDEMFVSLEITDSAGNPTPGAKYFMADNNDVGIQPIAESLNYNPTGTWAEWIVERPTQVDNTFVYVPQFTDVDFHDCSAQDNNPQHIVHRPCDLDTMSELVMVDYPTPEPTQRNELSVISAMGIHDDPGRFNVSWCGFGTPVRP